MALTKIRQEQGVVINEGSTDVDFRIESNGNANMIFVDGGSDHVNIGTSSDFGDTLNVSGSAHCSNSLTLSRQSADTGSSGLIFEKTRNTSVNGNTVVASGDQLGFIAFRGNDGDEFLDGAYIIGFVDGTPGDGDMPTRMSFHTTADGASSPTERMRIASDGAVHLRSAATPSSSVSGFMFSSDQFYTSAGDTTSTNTQVRFINGNGLVGSIQTSGSATSFVTSSDYRLKENVDYTWDATTRLKQLKPARFNWIADSDNTVQDGFLAHEVSSVVPEAVFGTKDAEIQENGDGYQSLDNSKLVPLLVKTIQELEARLTAGGL